MRVRVSRNSRRRGWSVRPVGSHKSPLVLPALCLRDVTFHVNKGLYDRWVDTAAPATFAWAEGEMCAVPAEDGWRPAIFIPAHFRDPRGAIKRARYARFNEGMEVVR